MDICTAEPCIACTHTASWHERRAHRLHECTAPGCVCSGFVHPSLVWLRGRCDGASDAARAGRVLAMGISDARALGAELDPTGTYGPYPRPQADQLGWVPPTPEAIAREIDLIPEAGAATIEDPAEIADYSAGWLAGRDMVWRPVLLARVLHTLGHPAAGEIDEAVMIALARLQRRLAARRRTEAGR